MKNEMLKLLIVDDEPWNFENLKTMIRWKDLSIEILRPARDGEEALRIFHDEEPDIILTDINMPFINGNELIKQVKAKCSKVQTIVVSGYDDFSYVREALLHGAIDYLLKPVTKKALLDVINKAITVIGDNSKDEDEKAKTHDKLLQASSFISDGEYSQLLKDITFSEKHTLLSHLELEYSMYTFVLFRLIDFNLISRKSEIPLYKMAYNVKKEIEGFSGKSKTLVFNNIYSRNDFILITNTDRKGIEDMYGIVPGVLKKRFGTRIRMFISQSYFSFDKIYNIYSEACLTLSLRHVNDIKAVYTLETTRTVNIKKRITSEQVRHLTFAIQSKNKGLVREIIFNEMGFNKKSLPHWLILEVSQSIEYLTGIFMHNFQTEAGIILSIENFNYLLNAALNSEDFDEMCSLLAQLLDDILPLHQNIGSSASMAKTITCVCEYIDEYYFRNISLSSLASIFSIERSYLCRSFKAYTGENLMLSIAKKRIQKAQEYIKQSVLSHDSLTQKELNLTEISDLVGYEEYSYFNRVFRKITGLSPSDYRAGFKEESEICAE